MMAKTKAHAVQRNVALEKFEQRFAKTFGEGRLRSAEDRKPYEVISTGCLTLDYAMGVGGYVEGKLTELWGVDGIGKTLMCLLGVIEAQRKHPEKLVAWIDMEHSFDVPWAKLHGVDTKMLKVYDPETAEDVADALKEILRSGLFSMVVVDSIGAMIPKKETEKDAEDATVGLQAKIVTRMVKIAAVEAANSATAVLLINQVRANISPTGGTTTGGGFALKHSTTHKLRFKRTGTPPYKAKLDGEDREVGHEVAVFTERNRVAPKRTATFSLFTVPTSKYGPVGVDRVDETITMGLKTKVITQGGAWYTLPDGERVLGREGVAEALRTNPNLFDSIRMMVLDSISHEVTEEQPEDEGSGSKFRSGADETNPE